MCHFRRESEPVQAPFNDQDVLNAVGVSIADQRGTENQYDFRTALVVMIALYPARSLEEKFPLFPVVSPIPLWLNERGPVPALNPYGRKKCLRLTQQHLLTRQSKLDKGAHEAGLALCRKSQSRLLPRPQ
jgi:hypothetical protein